MFVNKGKATEDMPVKTWWLVLGALIFAVSTIVSVMTTNIRFLANHSNIATNGMFDEQKDAEKGGLLASTLTPFFIYLTVIIGFPFIVGGFTPQDGKAQDHKSIAIYFYPAFIFLFIIILVGLYISLQDIVNFGNVVTKKYYDQNVLILKDAIVKLEAIPDTEWKKAVRQQFANWIYRFEKNEIDPDGVFKDYADDLWTYVEHRKNMELDDLERAINNLIQDPSQRQGARDNIELIRRHMRRMRAMTPDMEKVSKKFTTSMFAIMTVFIIAVMYLAFHYFYSEQPTMTTVASAAVVILLTLIFTAIGWVSNAVNS